MRIISGKYKGRRIDTLGNTSIRPTMGMAREALFNILSHGEFGKDGENLLEGCKILDLFCGCGAISVEALSRGAATAVLVDINQEHLDIARHNIMHIGEEKNAVFLRADSSNPPRAKFACNLIFIDPPYKENLALISLQNTLKNGWIEDNAIVIVETGKTEEFNAPSGFTELSNRKYGNCRLRIYRYKK